MKQHTKVYPLAQAATPPRLTFVDASTRPFNMVGPADFRFWELLNTVVQEETLAATDPTSLGYFAAAGIQKGRPFQPDDRMRRILTEAAATGDATARALFYRMRDPEGIIFPDRRWKFAFVGGYKFERQAGVPNLNARSFYFFAATGVTPAMDTQVVGEGSTYPGRPRIPTATPSTAARPIACACRAGAGADLLVHHRLRHPDAIDAADRQPLPFGQQPEAGPAGDPDRSVDVWFGPTAPAGRESNWVQTIPGKSWFVILRLYGPLQPWFDKTWRPGDIELQG